jgi:hypothetical protein
MNNGTMTPPAVLGNIGTGINAATNGGNLNGTALNATSVMKTALNWLTWIIGGISVVFIIIGGIRYATSGGDAEKVKKAKNTILHACIGLAVAVLSGAIALFVSGTLINGGALRGPDYSAPVAP